MEHKKFDVEVKEGNLELSLDTNQDGEKLMTAKVNMGEAIQEVLKKGEKIEGAKLVDFEMGIGGIKLVLDTDQDGEKLLELELNLAEALDESGLMK